MAQRKGMLRDFARYPKYKSNYIKAFERMVVRRKERGLRNKVSWNTGEEVFDWWTHSDSSQIKFEGFEDY